MRFLLLFMGCCASWWSRAQPTPDTLPTALVCERLSEDFERVHASTFPTVQARLAAFLQLSRQAAACGTQLRIVLHLNVAQQYGTLSRYDSLSLHARAAIALYDQDTTAVSPRQAATLFAYYGSALFYEHQYAAAIEQEYRGLRIREQHQLDDIGYSYENIALAYEEMEAYQKAETHYKRAEAHYLKQVDHGEDLARLHLNMGNLYSKQHDVRRALLYFNKAMGYAQTHQDQWTELDVIRAQVSLEADLRQYQRQLNMATRGLEIATNYGDSLSMLELYNERFLAHTSLGKLEEAQRDRRAIEFLLERIPAPSERSIYYENLAPYFMAQAAYDSAAWYYQRYKAIEDSLQETNLAEAVAEIETRYETEKKNDQIALLERESQLQAQRERLYGLIGLLLSGLLVALGFLYRWRTQRNRQLQELNALKDRFFSIIAHDLKTPLVGFRSITDALNRHHTDLPPERVAYFLGQLDRASHQLYDLLQNLLHWALSQTGKLRYLPQDLSAREEVAKTLALLAPSGAIRDLELEQAVPEEARVWADPQLLQTVLRNLLDNAIKFTPAGGRIGVDAQPEPTGWRLSVCDTGPGLTAEQQTQLLQGQPSAPRTRNAGTGLGLVLCRELVERQGGQLGITSEPGQGSRFWFTLPSSDQNP